MKKKYIIFEGDSTELKKLVYKDNHFKVENINTRAMVMCHNVNGTLCHIKCLYYEWPSSCDNLIKYVMDTYPTLTCGIYDDEGTILDN